MTESIDIDSLEPFEKPTVWVINRSAHDYSGALRYGEIRHMTTGPFDRYATSRIFRAMSNVLAYSNPEDYILLNGLTVMACIACSIFAVKHNRLNLLLFRPADNSYVERSISFDPSDFTTFNDRMEN